MNSPATFALSNENTAEPGLVGYVYDCLMQRSEPDAQLSMAGKIMQALELDTEFSPYIYKKYINNAEFIKKMPQQDRSLFLYILDNFTKEKPYYTKQEYQQAFQKVHHNTGSVVLNFGAK